MAAAAALCVEATVYATRQLLEERCLVKVLKLSAHCKRSQAAGEFGKVKALYTAVDSSTVICVLQVSLKNSVVLNGLCIEMPSPCFNVALF